MTVLPANPFVEGDGPGKVAADASLVIFGATGDLTRRKLVPALHSLYRAGFLDRFAVIGFARRPWSDAEFRAGAASMLGSPPAVAPGFLERLEYVASSFDDPAGYSALAARLAAGAAAGRRTVLYYLATPPENYATIAGRLGAMRPLLPPGMTERILVEKPFGRDGESARSLDEALHRGFPEQAVYRIDHYLGKETVQNLFAFRFGNGVFEPVWNSRYVDHVEITVAETVGVGTRGGYYERSGALRDMVQNHLFQLLALVAMESPNDLSPRSVRAEKLKVFRAIRPFSPARIALDTVRAQYDRGTIDGEAVPGYREEAGVDPASGTETYAALRLWIDSWRWSDTPFYLRVGKRLSRRISEIAIHFRAPPRSLFPVPGVGGDLLVFRIQPDEGFSLSVNTKIPGFTDTLRPTLMDFSYGAGFADAPRDAYERLILDALLGDASLYTSSDEVEAAWQVIDPILAAWEAGHPPLARYPAGSSGPVEARELIGSRPVPHDDWYGQGREPFAPSPLRPAPCRWRKL